MKKCIMSVLICFVLVGFAFTIDAATAKKELKKCICDQNARCIELSDGENVIYVFIQQFAGMGVGDGSVELKWINDEWNSISFSLNSITAMSYANGVLSITSSDL